MDFKEKYGISKLSGKVVIVTGASSGIGKACALEFATKGATVVLASRNFEMLKAVEAEISGLGGRALAIKTDVKKVDDCKSLINSALSKFGKIDVLINNAGISMRANFDEIELEVVDEVMETNFKGNINCTRFALPHIIENKGVIIAISSISGLAPLPGRTIYCASKYALEGFYNSLRIENFKKEIQILIVHPGFTASNIRINALNANGLPQLISPRDEAKMMSSQKLAKIIAKATFTGKRDLLVTTEGKLVVLLHRLFPRLADSIIYKQMKNENKSPLK